MRQNLVITYIFYNYVSCEFEYKNAKLQKRKFV